MDAKIHIIQTTLPESWIEAEVGAFSQLMLEAGAACAQHSSICSTYKWEGKTISSPEWRLQLKVAEKNLENVLLAVRENHPYQIPQIAHWSAETNAEYADWVNSV